MQLSLVLGVIAATLGQHVAEVSLWYWMKTLAPQHSGLHEDTHGLVDISWTLKPMLPLLFLAAHAASFPGWPADAGG